MAEISQQGQARHWAQVNEATCVLGMRLLFWVCRVFGRWPFRVVLYPVLMWYIATQSRARRASSSFLQRAGAAHGFMGVVRHFACFAETMLDKMLLWSGHFDASRVAIHGAEPLLEMIGQKRGALIICSHLGNLELSRVLSLGTPELKLTVLVHTRHAQAFNALLASLDPRSQLDLMQVTEMTPATAMQLSERIQAGGIVVIAGDRVPVSPSPRVAWAPFFGQPAAFPIGPYVMAAVLGCPVYTMFAVREGDSHAIHFECLRERVTLPRAAREQALRELAGEFAARLEYHARRSPHEWFNFYDFWQTPDLAGPDAAD